jgi:site-specific DNA-methyltransferase (adenine-specific)
MEIEQIGNIKLLNCDCMKYLKTVPDNFFELAIVDPQYGIGADKPSAKPCFVKQRNGNNLFIKKNNYQHKNWDSSPPSYEYFDELKRASINQIIFGVNYFDYNLKGGRIVWDKLNGESDQFGCEIAYCSFNNRTDIIYYMWSGMMQGLHCCKDIRKAQIQQGNKKLNEKRIHPTQKPVKLYKWFLSNYAKQGDKILDTHFGSLSLGVACDEMGFDLTACEKDKEYNENGRNRLIQFQNQLTIKF